MIRLLRIVFLIATAALFSQIAHAEKLGAEAWREDIEFLDREIRSTHPDPFTKLSESEWKAGVEQLRHAAANKTDRQLAIALMKQVALLKDGHTHLEPSDELGFDFWFPIRFYQFDDGIFITVAHREYENLIGAKVRRIGTTKPGKALNLVSTILSADNEFQKKELAAAFLSSAPLLQELAASHKATLNLPWMWSFPTEQRKRVTISATPSGFSPNYRFWGELFGPPHDDYDNYVTPFDGGKAPLAYRTVNEKAPPYYAGSQPILVPMGCEKENLAVPVQFRGGSRGRKF